MKNKHSDLFIFFAIVYVACVLISNVLATKLILVFGVAMTGGVIMFPVSYIIGDILTEVYGRKDAFKVITYGFVCNLVMVLTFYIAIKLPYPDYWMKQDAFSAILSNTPRLFISSVLGYFAGGLSNSYVMDKMKEKSQKKTSSRSMSLRMILSTIIGEYLDTAVFLLIGFIGTISLSEITIMILFQSLAKVVYEVIFVPITITVSRRIAAYEESLS